MKRTVLFTILAVSAICSAQPRAENAVIITIDGLRWQEIFSGMDTSIAQDPRFNQGDSAGIFQLYGDKDPEERRKKLFPFLWGTVRAGGRLYGNRFYGNKVDDANPYWFSYPGYSEIFCGFVDTAINTNEFPDNPHTNILEFLNTLGKYRGRVGAFCSWDAFERILNEKRSGIPVVSAFEPCGGSSPTPKETLLNEMLENSYKPWGSEECLDMFTHYEAVDYIETRKPRILYIAYGETDEWAHSGMYRNYLSAAHQVDAWMGEIWQKLQNDAQYRDRTALLVTVDHGRGGQAWTSHGRKIGDSHETWLVLMCPGITPEGEMRTEIQIFEKQYAQTIASLLGVTFTAAHPIAEKIDLR